MSPFTAGGGGGDSETPQEPSKGDTPGWRKDETVGGEKKSVLVRNVSNGEALRTL